MPVIEEVYFEYTRSRGPGGQHVNRTQSAAILRWHVPTSNSYSEEDKAKILEKLGNYINSEGFLSLRSDQFRDQDQNRKACLDRLDQLLKQALFKPKKRVKTKPTRSSVKKRLDSKRKHSETKKGRQGQWD